MIYWRYFWRIVLHKLLVLVECSQEGITWRGVTHDLSKFRPDEFFASARYHLIEEGDVNAEVWAKIQAEGKVAWGLHKERNAHHPEFWDLGEGSYFPMSRESRLEMVCDWRAAEYYPGAKSTLEYYASDRESIPLDEETRTWVELYIGYH